MRNTRKFCWFLLGLVGALVLLAPFAAAQAPILVANYASLPQRGWVFVATPDAPPKDAGWLRDSAGAYAPYVREPGGLRLWCSLPPGGTSKFELIDKGREALPFAWHPTIEFAALQLLPRWTLGDVEAPPAALDITLATDASLVVHMRTRFEAARVTVDCWLRATSGEPVIDWMQCATYGDTRNDGQAQSVLLPELRAHSSGRIVDDEWRRHGVGLATWAEGTWTQTCVPAGTRWHRASRFVARGAILAAADPARLEGRPLVALSLGWADKWGPLGAVPIANPAMTADAARWRGEWEARAPGTYLGPRNWTQPGYAGTTGEQVGFGWASHWAVSLQEPWQILAGLYEAEAYAIRPTANREPDGSPMRASLHPGAKTTNQRPDNVPCPDRLGWPQPNRIEWIPAAATVPYTTESDEHTSPADLAAIYTLTRDPLFGSIIVDQIELAGTDDYVLGHRVPSGRAVGRLAMRHAWFVWCGFPEAAQVLRVRLDDALALRAALYGDVQVRPIGAPEFAKRGWADPGSSEDKPGWQPWQQMIAAVPLRAAWRVLGDQRYLQVSEELAQMVLDNAFQEQSGRLLHAYALRANGGQPWPPEAWPVMGDRREAFSTAVYVTPDTGFWSACAGQLLLSHPRAKAALLAFPVRTTIEARWRAIR